MKTINFIQSSLSDNKTIFRISSKQYKTFKNTVTYVGRVRWYSNGRYIFSDSTGIHRLTPEDAQHDAQIIAADRMNDLRS